MIKKVSVSGKAPETLSYMRMFKMFLKRLQCKRNLQKRSLHTGNFERKKEKSFPMYKKVSVQDKVSETFPTQEV